VETGTCLVVERFLPRTSRAARMARAAEGAVIMQPAPGLLGADCFTAHAAAGRHAGAPLRMRTFRSAALQHAIAVHEGRCTSPLGSTGAAVLAALDAVEGYPAGRDLADSRTVVVLSSPTSPLLTHLSALQPTGACPMPDQPSPSSSPASPPRPPPAYELPATLRTPCVRLLLPAGGLLTPSTVAPQGEAMVVENVPAGLLAPPGRDAKIAGALTALLEHAGVAQDPEHPILALAYEAAPALPQRTTHVKFWLPGAVCSPVDLLRRSQGFVLSGYPLAVAMAGDSSVGRSFPRQPRHLELVEEAFEKKCPVAGGLVAGLRRPLPLRAPWSTWSVRILPLPPPPGVVVLPPICWPTPAPLALRA
jgi:hypothetical protein